MKNKLNHKSVLYLIAVIVFLNTLAILALFVLFNRKIDNINKTLTNFFDANAQQLRAEEIDLPPALYPFLGDKDAPVEMILIIDFECPPCQNLYSILFPKIVREYSERGLLKIGYMPYPLESRHPKALPAALAVHCASQQDLFRPMFFYLANNIEKLQVNEITQIPQKMELDSSLFTRCIESQESTAVIRELRVTLEQKGIKGTPSVIINGNLIKGISGYTDITTVINNELAKRSINITIEKGNSLIHDNETVVLDVRTPEEYEKGHVPGARNIDIMDDDTFKDLIQELPKEKKYVLYCKSGTRSAWAFHIMNNEGFSSLFNMIEGFDGWNEQNMEIEK